MNLEGIGRGVFELLCMEGPMKKTSARLVDVPAKIRTKYLQNRDPKRYIYPNLFGTSD